MDEKEEPSSVVEAVAHPATSQGDEGDHSDPCQPVPHRTWTTKEISSLAKVFSLYALI